MLDYLPAISIDLNLLKTIEKYEKDTPIGKYFDTIFSDIKEKYLISYGLSHNVKNIKETYKLKWIMGDSGGYQLAQSVFNKNLIIKHITADKVLNWLEQECDVGMNLDIPPPITSQNYQNDFNISLNKSIENFTWFTNHRNTQSKLKLYNVVHGRDFDCLNEWFNKVKNFDFEGYAISLFPYTDTTFLSLQLVWLDEVLKKENKDLSNYYLHILGATSIENILLLKYFDCYKKIPLITADSSSHSVGAQFRGIVNSNVSFDYNDLFLKPKMTRFTRIFREIDLNAPDEDRDTAMGGDEYKAFINSKYKFPCMCFSCNLWNQLDVAEIKSPSTLSEFLNIHNISSMNSIVKQINWMGETNFPILKNYVEILRNKFSKNFIKAIEIQKAYFEQGISFSKILTLYGKKVYDIYSEVDNKGSQYDDINSLID